MSVTDVAANAAVSGASALLVASLGVEPQAIIWAIVGSILGVTFAPKTTKPYAVAMFLAATLICALVGTYVSTKYFGGAPLERNLTAVMLAATFHPALKVMIERAGTVIGAWLDRLVAAIGGQPK